MDLYGSSVEVDYRGVEVTVENFVRVLTGKRIPGAFEDVGGACAIEMGPILT